MTSFFKSGFKGDFILGPLDYSITYITKWMSEPCGDDNSDVHDVDDDNDDDDDDHDDHDDHHDDHDDSQLSRL